MAYDDLKIGKKNPAKDNNNLNQRVNDVSAIESDRNYNQQAIAKEESMARLWGEHYQTEQDSAKMDKFQTEMDAPINPAIQELASTASGAFSQGETGMAPEDFTNLLYHTGFHESDAISGQPQISQGYYNNSGQWVTSGPAGSYFQVEPSTLRDLVTATQPSGSTNPSKQYWGPEAERLSKYSAKQLYEMTDEQLSALLQDPNNQMLGAIAAGAKYAKSFKKPVNDTMDAYNKTEDIFKQ
jgi:hypothetical protein